MFEHPTDQVHVDLDELGGQHKVTARPVVNQDILRVQVVTERVKQAQLMLIIAAFGHLEHRPTRQRKEHRQAHNGKTTTRLREQLSQTGWISQGYVQDRGPGAGGPCYQWTRKVKGKTVSVALSREQYQGLKEAIGNWRKLQETLKEMQKLSRQFLFETLPNPKRRKRLGKKVLGLI